MTLVLESISFFSLLNKNCRLRESCCYCKMQPCAKKRLSTRRAFTYFYKVSFFSKDPFFFSLLRLLLRLLRAMHALELLISRRRGRRPSLLFKDFKALRKKRRTEEASLLS